DRPTIQQQLLRESSLARIRVADNRKGPPPADLFGQCAHCLLSCAGPVVSGANTELKCNGADSEAQLKALPRGPVSRLVRAGKGRHLPPTRGSIHLEAADDANTARCGTPGDPIRCG